MSSIHLVRTHHDSHYLPLEVHVFQLLYHLLGLSIPHSVVQTENIHIYSVILEQRRGSLMSVAVCCETIQEYKTVCHHQYSAMCKHDTISSIAHDKHSITQHTCALGILELAGQYLSIVAANSPNLYSAGLSTYCLGSSLMLTNSAGALPSSGLNSTLLSSFDSCSLPSRPGTSGENGCSAPQ
jgi:hypothetical protein